MSTIQRPAKGRRLGAAVYVLPNMFTTGNLFFGFFSIIKSLQGDFRWAASAIMLASIFDVLDGRVARLTGGTSEFGVQYDSLCDLVSFGVAPAIMVFQFGLVDYGRIGWIFCFFFMACGALRLARFNVLSSIGKSSGDFTGLPIPMAAIVNATYVLVCVEASTAMGEAPEYLRIFFSALSEPVLRKQILLVACPLLAFLMVSNFSYRSHKLLKVKGIGPFRLLVMAVGVAAVVAYQPEMVGFVLTATYALSGPFEWIVGWKKTVEDDEIFAPIEDDDSALDPAFARESRGDHSDHSGRIN
jgi:CDP-diacylglycerol--serine O-phosphatidyltransferase